MRRLRILTAALALSTAAVALGPIKAAAPAVVVPSACSLSTRQSADRRITYFRHCADTPEMVAFRGGRYRMGDAEGRGMAYEQPVHDVQLRPFAIGRYEVTRAEWQVCVTAGACTEPRKTPAGVEAGGHYPVASVSWMQTRDYVGWLVRHSGRGYRLPSEAEWEYAARAGTTGAYPWRLDGQEQLACQYANLLDRSGTARHPELGWLISCDDGYGEAAPVGSLRPNAWGVYDMLGNVWEWVEDCWHPSYDGAPTDGSAWTTGGNCRKRVNRGGGWGNGLGTLRLSNRDADPVGSSSDGLGFRVAISVAPPTIAAPPASR